MKCLAAVLAGFLAISPAASEQGYSLRGLSSESSRLTTLVRCGPTYFSAGLPGDSYVGPSWVGYYSYTGSAILESVVVLTFIILK